MFIFEFFLRQYSAHGGAVATVAEEGEWEVASAQCVSISAAVLDAAAGPLVHQASASCAFKL